MSAEKLQLVSAPLQTVLQSATKLANFVSCLSRIHWVKHEVSQTAPSFFSESEQQIKLKCLRLNGHLPQIRDAKQVT